MEVESAKVLDNGRRIVVDLKRKRAARFMADVTGAAGMEARYSDSPPQMLCKRIKSDECNNNLGSYVNRAFLRNYSNFMKSGLPKRVLFYENGEWNDFPEGFIGMIKDDILLKKAAIEVDFKGFPSLLDFLHMIVVDLKTGLQLPIAWIDEADCCFFPEVYSSTEELRDCFQSGGRVNQTVLSSDETHEIKLQLEIEVNACEGSKMEEGSEESNTLVKQFNAEDKATELDEQDSNYVNQAPEIKATVVGNKQLDSQTPSFELVQKILHPDSVQRMFFTGIGASLTTLNIIGIQRCSSYWAQARFEIFKKQIEITENCRGNANVRFAWLASSKEAVSKILKHGLGFEELSKTRPARGIGVHLSSGNCSRISANYCDVDENGIQHLVLCRVILGNMELIHPGSKTFNPDKENFDSAVDDLQDPKHFLIWNANMNTNIYPEFVISFKMPQNGKGYQVASDVSGVTANSAGQGKLPPGSPPTDSVRKCQESPNSVEIFQGKNLTISFADKPPTSPWMPFPLLFAALEKKLSSNAMKILNLSYEQFSKKEINRDSFVQKLRSVTGDVLLRETILILQGKLPGGKSQLPMQAIRREAAIAQELNPRRATPIIPKQEQGTLY